MPSCVCAACLPLCALQLNGYICGIIRARRAERAASGGKAPAKPDILDRVLQAAEVRACVCVCGGGGGGGGMRAYVHACV